MKHKIEIRVRYHEIDGQSRVHNSQYLNYFERGRVEMLRAAGISYRELEDAGLLLVVRTMHIDFHLPAEFDDILTLQTTLSHCHGARIEHRYELIRAWAEKDAGFDKIVTGRSVIGCIDRDGRVRRLPKQLQLNLRSDDEQS